jgi:hypothetical protein
MTNSKQVRLNAVRSLKLTLIILAFTCCGYAFGPVEDLPKPDREWTLYPAVVEVDTEEDFAAVSDPHGSYERFLRVLSATGWVSTDPQPKWTESAVPGGKGSVLIVVGDLIDKGDDSLKVVELLRALQKDASAKGGRVIVTMGNHEAEFLKKWNNGNAAKFRQQLEAVDLVPEKVANCQGELGQWLCQLPLAARVNDWFFCHSGYTKGRSISQLNSDIAQSFKAESKNGFKAPEITGDYSILEARLDKTGPQGMPWFKGGNSETKPDELLKSYTAALGVGHIVMGHKPGELEFPNPGGAKGKTTRNSAEMFQAYNGLLFMIDTDMVRDTSNKESIGASLYIKGPKRQKSDYNGNVTAFVNCPNPKFYGRPPLWDSTKPMAFSGQYCTDK